MFKRYTVRELTGTAVFGFYPHANRVINMFDSLESAVYNARLLAEHDQKVFVSEDLFAGIKSLEKHLPYKKKVIWKCWPADEERGA